MDSSTFPQQALTAALVDAYPGWVARRLAEQGLAAPEGIDAAVAAGRSWLATTLQDLLGRPFAEQRRSPLEVFQEAMRFPTAALAAAGIEEPARDAAQQRALPGDRYDLAPASSQPLGEDVWQAHLAWGAAKAAAHGRRVAARVLYVGNNLMDRADVERAAGAAGLAVTACRSADDVAGALAAGGRPLRAFVDLTVPDADEAVRAAAATGVTVIAFGPHVDDWALDRARSLGAADALPRSRFFRRLPELFPTQV